MIHEGSTATADLAVLPGVLGSKVLDVPSRYAFRAFDPAVPGIMAISTLS
jgi:hypothetical protein